MRRPAPFCPGAVVDADALSRTSTSRTRSTRCTGPSPRSLSAGAGGTELPAAVRAARQLVRLAPLRESGYQVLMRAMDAQGNAADALQVYAILHDVLREELGVAPSAQTQAVYNQLNQA